MNGIETERKFLIEKPGNELLSRLGGDDIVQTYLEPEDGGTARIRARTRDGVTTYTHTVKRRISPISSYEDERVIGEEEYLTLETRREEGTEPVKKTRYLLPYRGFIFEIDVYPLWEKTAVMEVELPEEETEFSLPPEIRIIKEVSGDRRFSNHSLSRCFPEEESVYGE